MLVFIYDPFITLYHILFIHNAPHAIQLLIVDTHACINAVILWMLRYRVHLKFNIKAAVCMRVSRKINVFNQNL